MVVFLIFITHTHTVNTSTWASRLTRGGGGGGGGGYSGVKQPPPASQPPSQRPVNSFPVVSHLCTSVCLVTGMHVVCLYVYLVAGMHVYSLSVRLSGGRDACSVWGIKYPRFQANLEWDVAICEWQSWMEIILYFECISV